MENYLLNFFQQYHPVNCSKHRRTGCRHHPFHADKPRHHRHYHHRHRNICLIIRRYLHRKSLGPHTRKQNRNHRRPDPHRNRNKNTNPAPHRTNIKNNHPLCHPRVRGDPASKQPSAPRRIPQLFTIHYSLIFFNYSINVPV